MKLLYIKIFFLSLMLFPSKLFAQDVIRGMVSDKHGPIPGAYVFLINKDNRTITGSSTNENGEYLFTIPAGVKDMQIGASFIGMKNFRTDYTGQKVLNIVLEEEVTTLDEYVVTAKKVNLSIMGVNADDLGVARQKIDLEEFQDMAVTSVEDMLQGKMTNVDIIGMGDPGVRATIRIRGTSSLNADNEPLIIVDGVPVNNIDLSDFEFGTADMDDYGALMNISPNDIESVETLKDAATTALYGPQAAGGVLLITTKRGAQSKPSFSVTQKMWVNWEPKAIPMLKGKEYVTLMQDALWNAAQYDGFQIADVNNLTKYPEVLYDKSYEYFNEYNQETNWLDLITRTGFSSETTFSMSGGGQKARYRFSVGYLSEDGTTVGASLKRLTTRLNLDYRLSDKLLVSTSFSYAEGNRDQPFVMYPNITVRSNALTKMPNMSPWVIDKETGLPTDQYFTQSATSIQGNSPSILANPVAWARKSEQNSVNRDAVTNFTLNYQILSNLHFNSVISLSFNTSKNRFFWPVEASGVPLQPDLSNDGRGSSSYLNNQAQESAINSINVFNRSRIFYKLQLNKHIITPSAFIEINDKFKSEYSTVVYSVASGELADPSGGGTIKSLDDGKTQTRSVGISGQLNYEYDQRFSVNAAFRTDADSRTGRDIRWGTFPTFSAQWRIHNERFLNDVSWLEELRLNASWGQTGNSPKGAYTYVGTVAPETGYITNSAVKPSAMQLNGLKWETTTSWNLGFRSSFFKGKLELEFDYYTKVTNDLLHDNMGIPSTVGVDKVGKYNSGKMENTGWEVSVNLKNIVDKNGFRLSVSNLNISRNRNKIIKLPQHLSEETYNNANGEYAVRLLEGRPLGAFFGYNCLGVYQNINETYARDPEGNIIRNVNGEEVIMKNITKEVQPGDAKYADHNHDGVINRYDMVYLGNFMPIITGGGAIQLVYKQFSLRGSFHFRAGQKVINQTRIDAENMYSGTNQRRAVLKRWRYEGDDTNIPRALYKKGFNYLGSDRFVENNSFLKCKDITLSYSLPKSFIQKFGLTRMSFALTTYNIFTITKYKGQDPETSLPSGKDTTKLAKDTSKAPPARKGAFSIAIDF